METRETTEYRWS